MIESGNQTTGTEEPGTVIGGYRIERLLGAGGMGAVYAARHPRLPRVDALKVLPTAFSGDPTYRGRFEREADMAAALDHPNIVPVYDRGNDDGRLWMTMKLIPGEDAAAMLAKSPQGLPVNRVLTIVEAVASALDYAHGKGLLHRDVKPGNILIDATGATPRIMLGDFGIARQQQEHSDLTSVGMVVGTLDYASPEQLSGDAVDGRSDQYSLAGTTVQLLTGRKPFAASSGTAVIRDHLMSPPPAPSRVRTDLPPAIDAVIARGMAKAPQQRYGTCREFAQALRSAAASTHQSTPSNRVGPQQRVPTPPPTAAHRPPTPAPHPASSPQWRAASAGLTGPVPAGLTGPATAAPSQRQEGGTNRGVIIGAVAAVVVVAIVAVVALVLAGNSNDSSSNASANDPGASTSAQAGGSDTTTAQVNNTSTLRDGYIDPCKLPASVTSGLGLSTLTDDPVQRATEGVKLACKASDAKSSNAEVKFATFETSPAWESGKAVDVAGSSKWHTFDVDNTVSGQPGFCVTAYKSLDNGVLYVAIQKVAGRDCSRGAEIAAAITSYLPQ